MRRCFVSDDFISGQYLLLGQLLSPEIRFYFYQKDPNVIIPGMTFISGYFMLTAMNKNYFISCEIKSPVTTPSNFLTPRLQGV